MADGILGLGSSGSVDLSSELITKLKTAESKSVLDPITTNKEDTQAELDALTEIQTMVSELLDLVDDFDLYTSGTNIFNEITATTTGSSVTFNATDTSKLNPGTISVSVQQLAQKDVYKSDTIKDITSTMPNGTMSITVGGTTYPFTTDGKSYEDLIEEMNYNSKLDVSLEKVSDTEYRMIAKSKESGTANAISISNTLAEKYIYESDTISDITSTMVNGNVSVTVGGNIYSFTTNDKSYEDLVAEMNSYTDLDVSLEKVSDTEYYLIAKSSGSGTDNEITISQSGDVKLGGNIKLGFENVLPAQNMKAKVDGVDYDVSSNKITMQNGLTIQAVSVDTITKSTDDDGKPISTTTSSSISMERDTSTIVTRLQDIASKYNDLVDLVDSYTIGDENDSAIISDSSTLKTMMSTIKEVLFDNYGKENEENMFKYGISFDSDGYFNVDSTKLTNAVTNNYDDLKELFTGYAEKEGIGTRLKTYLDSLDSSNGLLTTYENKLNTYMDTLSDDYDAASDKLDEKYTAMSTQFAAYTVLITQMENSFASLKLLIDTSTSSS